jgi:hypothetical protein
MFCPLLSKNLIGGGALVQQHLVFAQSVLLDPAGTVRTIRIGDGLTIRGRARPGKHLVGARSRTADDGICRLIDRGQVLVERKVGPLTLDAKTLVGISALRSGALLLGWHVSRECTTGDRLRDRRVDSSKCAGCSDGSGSEERLDAVRR